MPRISVIVRLLLLLLCLVPFTSARQLSGALAIPVAKVPLAPSNESPDPLSEEDDRESADGKERLTAPARHRFALAPQIGRLPAARDFPVRATLASTRSPFDADPLHNGLGSPYRC